MNSINDQYFSSKTWVCNSSAFFSSAVFFFFCRLCSLCLCWLHCVGFCNTTLLCLSACLSACLLESTLFFRFVRMVIAWVWGALCDLGTTEGEKLTRFHHSITPFVLFFFCDISSSICKVNPTSHTTRNRISIERTKRRKKGRTKSQE